MRRFIDCGVWTVKGKNPVRATLTIDVDKLGRLVSRARESGAKRKRRADCKKRPSFRATLCDGAFAMEISETIE